MIDTVLNLLFRCAHRRLTRPVTPVARRGADHGETYVVCLDCGKQLLYDLDKMRVGKPLDTSHDSGVLHPEMPPARGKKLRYALVASLPLAVLLGSALKSGKPKEKPKPDAAPEPPDKDRGASAS